MLSNNEVWCPACGFSNLNKSKYTKDGKPREQCNICAPVQQKQLSQIKRYKRKCNTDKLLPFLLKDNDELSKEELYCLGYLFASGSIIFNNDCPNLRIEISQKNLESIYLIKYYLKFPTAIIFRNKSNGDKDVLLAWQHEYSYPYLLSKGFMAHKRGREELLPYMKKREFIRGYFDAKGSLFVNKNKDRFFINLTCANKKFMEDLNKYIKSQCGVCAASVRTIEKKGNILYSITLYKRNMLQFCEWLYKDCGRLYLKSNYDKYLDIKDIEVRPY